MAKPNYLYFIRHTPPQHVKIGIAIDPHQRLKRLSRHTDPTFGYHTELEIVTAIKTPMRASYVEKVLHSLLLGYRVTGEWFNLSDDVLQSAIEYAHFLTQLKLN